MGAGASFRLAVYLSTKDVAVTIKNWDKQATTEYTDENLISDAESGSLRPPLSAVRSILPELPDGNQGCW